MAGLTYPQTGEWHDDLEGAITARWAQKLSGTHKSQNRQSYIAPRPRERFSPRVADGAVVYNSPYPQGTAPPLHPDPLLPHGTTGYMPSRNTGFLRSGPVAPDILHHTVYTVPTGVLAQGPHQAQQQAQGAMPQAPQQLQATPAQAPEQSKIRNIFRSVFGGKRPPVAGQPPPQPGPMYDSPPPMGMQGPPPPSIHAPPPMGMQGSPPFLSMQPPLPMSPARHQHPIPPTTHQEQQMMLMTLHGPDPYLPQGHHHHPHTPHIPAANPLSTINSNPSVLGKPPLPVDPMTLVPQHFTPVHDPNNPMMTALSEVAFTNELLRKESTARTLGLRCLLDFIYDNFDAFDEASKQVHGHPSGQAKSTLRAVLREAAASPSMRGPNISGPNARLWVMPSPAAAPARRDVHDTRRLVRLASFNVQGLDVRDPQGANQLYNVAQTLHMARPDVVALQDIGGDSLETPQKLASLLNLWAQPDDGIWMAAAMPKRPEQHESRDARDGVAQRPRRPVKLQAFLYREQPQVLSLVRGRGRGWRQATCILPPFPDHPPRSQHPDPRAPPVHSPGVHLPDTTCLLFRAHGQLVLMASAVLTSEAQAGYQGQQHPHQPPPISHGHQAHHILRCLEDLGHDQAEALQERPCLGVAFSIDIRGQEDPAVLQGAPSVLSTLAEGDMTPLVSPAAPTSVTGHHHLDNVCMQLAPRSGQRSQHHRQESQALWPVQGGSGALGIGHLIAPAHCSRHRLVWADLQLAGPEERLPGPQVLQQARGPLQGVQDRQQRGQEGGGGYGLDAEDDAPRGKGRVGSPAGQRWEDRDDPAPRRAGPTGTYAQVVNGKAPISSDYDADRHRPSGYGLDADLRCTSKPAGGGRGWDDDDGGYGLGSETVGGKAGSQPPSRTAAAGTTAVRGSGSGSMGSSAGGGLPTLARSASPTPGAAAAKPSLYGAAPAPAVARSTNSPLTGGVSSSTAVGPTRSSAGAVSSTTTTTSALRSSATPLPAANKGVAPVSRAASPASSITTSASAAKPTTSSSTTIKPGITSTSTTIKPGTTTSTSPTIKPGITTTSLSKPSTPTSSYGVKSGFLNR